MGKPRKSKRHKRAVRHDETRIHDGQDNRIHDVDADNESINESLLEDQQPVFVLDPDIVSQVNDDDGYQHEPKHYQQYVHPSRLDHLDGIRALALIGVLLYHFELFWCRGGYTGVDVFFVLSGFLMTRNICSAIWQEAFSLQDFYIARFWRLYPSSVLTVLCTLIAGGLVMGESMLIELRKSAMSTLFMFSNFLFGSQIGGYFDGGAATKPLLHTWSLSVEEQFYACYPLFLVMFVNKGKSFFIILLVITLLSFGLAVHFVKTYPIWTWYLLPTRIYEFVLGAIVFFLYDFIPENQIWHEYGSAIGLFGVIGSYWSMSDETRFPGWASLPSTLGAGMLILSPQSTLSTWVLSSFISKWLGRISYAAYLVHWPIWVLVVYVTNSHVYGLQCLAASIVFGWLQFVYFESPVREHRPKAVVFLWVVAIVLAVIPQLPSSSVVSFVTTASSQYIAKASPTAGMLLPASSPTPNQFIPAFVTVGGSVAAPASDPTSSTGLPPSSITTSVPSAQISTPFSTTGFGSISAIIPPTKVISPPNATEGRSEDPYPDVLQVPPELNRETYNVAIIDDFHPSGADRKRVDYASWYNGNMSELPLTVSSVHRKEKPISTDQVPELFVAGDSYFLYNFRNPLRYLAYHTNISIFAVSQVCALGLGYTKDQIKEMTPWRKDYVGFCVEPSYSLNVVFENVNRPAIWLLVFRWHYTPLMKYEWSSQENWDRFDMEFPKLLQIFRAKGHQLIIVTATAAPPHVSPKQCVERLGKVGGPKKCDYWDDVAEEVLNVNRKLKTHTQPYLDSFVTLIDSENAYCRQDESNPDAFKCRVRAQDGEPMYKDGPEGHLLPRGTNFYFQPLIQAYQRARRLLDSPKP